MSGKKRIVIVSVSAVASFAAMMSVAMFLAKPPPRPTRSDANAAGAAAAVAEGPQTDEAGRLSPKEKQLDDLIREVQQKIADCKQKERSFEERESRAALVQEMLKKQSKDLENQLVRLLARQASLTQEEEKLEKSRLRIVQEEKVNLKHTASIYEKMDPSSGGRILLGMCESQQTDDAVRILHYMGDRAAAKILAEITDKALAARLTEMLKRVREEG